MLHHLPALRQVLGVVIGRLDAVPFRMGQLAFDHVRRPALARIGITSAPCSI